MVELDTHTFLDKVTEALECDVVISENQMLEGVEEWDSLGILAMVDLLEEIGVEADLQKLGQIQSVKELMELAGVAAND